MTGCRTLTLFATLALSALALLLPSAQAQDRKVPRSGTELKLSFAPVVRRAAPPVVNVYAARTVEVRNPL
ncbi:MAG: serine protease, partial [Pseudorhodoplanes sp.]